MVDPVGSTGKVDWTTGVITAVGIGAPPCAACECGSGPRHGGAGGPGCCIPEPAGSGKGRTGRFHDPVENFIVTSDVIRTQVSGIIQGATIMDKKYMSDGSVEVTVGMKLTGALAEALLPKTPPASPTPIATPGGASPRLPGQLYTGLIVDARGLGVRPAMAPKILNEDGKEVYGSAYINRDWAVREGMAGYLKGDPAAGSEQSPRYRQTAHGKGRKGVRRRQGGYGHLQCGCSCSPERFPEPEHARKMQGHHSR